ncbi:MAG: hypothetical protein JWQ16_1270, partial [Novosphingobium sp.]|nr:hypothetical protein [Novosphingobium sp.]
EDFGLWARLLPRHKVMNVGQALVQYRVHAGSVTSKTRARQFESHARASRMMIEALAPDAAVDFAMLSRVIRSLVLNGPLEPHSIEALLPWLGAYNREVAQRHGSHGGNDAQAEQAFILFKAA